jgi:hypothetical protein
VHRCRSVVWQGLVHAALLASCPCALLRSRHEEDVGAAKRQAQVRDEEATEGRAGNVTELVALVRTGTLTAEAKSVVQSLARLSPTEALGVVGWIIEDLASSTVGPSKQVCPRKHCSLLFLAEPEKQSPWRGASK